MVLMRLTEKFMRVRALARSTLVGMMLLSMTGAASAETVWDKWLRLSDQRCPSHHVGWACGDCNLSITEAFEGTLSPAQQHRIRRLADLKRRCAAEVGGFGCEVSNSLRAYEAVGLMPRFVKFSCQAVKCEEAASCSRMPPGP
jgi:hypothetical protein